MLLKADLKALKEFKHTRTSHLKHPNINFIKVKVRKQSAAASLELSNTKEKRKKGGTERE